MSRLLSINNYYYHRGGSEAVFFGHNRMLEELGWDKDAVVQDMLRGPYPLLPKPPEEYYADWEKKLLAL